MVQVPVEISVGCEATFIEPLHIHKKGHPLIYPRFYKGVVTGKINFCNAKIYNIEVPNFATFRVVYWRIKGFTFGGVWMTNHKFNQRRIDEQIRGYNGHEKR